MSDKRVTYLIGAGASANALPVVNVLNKKLKIFIEELKLLIHIFNLRATPEYRGFGVNELFHIEQLIDEISNYQTIDTFAKKQYLIGNPKYELTKNLLSCFLIYEQLDKNSELYNEVSKLYNERGYHSDALKKMSSNYVDIDNVVTNDEREILRSKYLNQLDVRYESLYASLLERQTPFPLIGDHLNFVSWNYDMQFEIAYKDYCSTGIDYIQQILNVYPGSLLDINKTKSTIIKLNGTGNFLLKESNLYSNKYDFIKFKYDRHTLHYLISQLSVNRSSGNEDNQLKFAWEKDEQVIKARGYAKEIITNSDVIVVIGYSFPTFNREVDREIFRDFDLSIQRPYERKIYIQDMPNNVSKIKERLKAIGNNLFDVAEIYDDVDQFFIPPEL